MRTILLAPGEAGVIMDIPNELHALQKAVDGYIEVLPLRGGLIAIINEEGRINGLPFNRAVYGRQMDPVDFIFGNVIVCGDAGEEFRGLTEDEVKTLLDKHRDPKSEISLGV